MSAFDQEPFDIEQYKNQNYQPLDPKELEIEKERYYNQVMAEIRRDGPHPKEIWLTNDRQAFLRNVINELSDDSEDDIGRKVYKPEHDEILYKLLDEKEKHERDFAEKQLQIIEENKERIANNMKPLKVPTEKDYNRLPMVNYVLGMIEDRERAFLGLQEEDRKDAFGFYQDDSDGRFKGDRPNIINQLNLAIINQGLPEDKRCEMAILALRERRRYNQVRRLGIKVPLGYARIHSIKIMPKDIQNEMLKYPSGILDDSDYEEDEEVEAKYKNDPLVYIQNNSQHNREKIENGEEPLRYFAAREKAGDLRFKDIGFHILDEATHYFLEDNGVPRGWTKEKEDGTYRRPAHLTPEYVKEGRSDYLVEYIKLYVDKYGLDMFVKYPGARDYLLNALKGNRIKLRKYPYVIKALYYGEEQLIPEDLQVQENQHESRVIQEFEARQSKRQSTHSQKDLTPTFNRDHIMEEENDVDQPLASYASPLEEFMRKSRIEHYERSAFADSSDSDERRVQERLALNDLMNQIPYAVIEYNEIQANPADNQDHLLKIMDDSSSNSSVNIYEQENARRRQAKADEMLKQLEDEQNQRENETWYELYDYMLHRTNDLGLAPMKEFNIDQQSLRKLSRREQTTVFQWQQLGASAEQSDDSQQKALFENPLLIAKQKVHNQKRIPLKSKFKERAYNDLVDINGVKQKWGEFKENTIKSVQNQLKNGKIVTNLKFLINQGDKRKEKSLFWNSTTGFQSENSDDEMTVYNRLQRHFIQDRLRKQGNQPYLRSRPILPWERMMLRYGGSEIIKRISGKSFVTSDVTTIYEWVDLAKPLFFDFGDFCLQKTREAMDSMYRQERAMQQVVMPDEKQLKSSIFSNEMMQIYLILRKVSKDQKVHFPQELQRALPKSKREYLENINFQLFKSPQSSPKKRSEEGKQDRGNGQQNDNLSEEAVSIGQFDDQAEGEHDYQDQLDHDVNEIASQVDQMNINSNEQSPFKTDEKLKISKSKIAQISNEKSQQPPRIVQTEVPKFIIPDNKGPDYSILQRKLFNYQETTFVDDYIEIKNMLAELQALDPAKLEQTLLPKLEKLIQDSNGRLKGYFIWPHHRVGGLEEIYLNGQRRYPKRLRQYQSQAEDKAIYLGGIEVGFLLANVPHLHPDTWKGAGLPISNLNGVYQRSPSKERATEEKKRQLQAAAQQQQQPPRINPKKRKAAEAMITDNNNNNGMNNAQKDKGILEVEKLLPFMKLSSLERAGSFEVENVDRNFNRGLQIRVETSVMPRKYIESMEPSLKSIVIVNSNKESRLKIEYKQPKQSGWQTANISDTFKLGANFVYRLTNESQQQRPINIVFLITK